MPDGDENQAPPVSAEAQTAPTPANEIKPSAPSAEQVGLRVSLIPEEELNRRDPRAGFKRWLVAVIIAAVVMGGICAYLGITIRSARQQIALLNAQTTELKKQSEGLTDSLAGAKKVQSRLRALGSLLGSHQNVARVFSFLEQHTLADVAYSSIAITESGSISLTATASSYEAYAGQLNELNAQPEVKALTASGLSPIYDSAGNFQMVHFNLALTLDPSIFLVKNP